MRIAPKSKNICTYDSLNDTSRVRLAAFTLLAPIRRFLILSWGKASNQIRNASSPFQDLSFFMLDWRVSLICVTKSGVPNSERDQLSV
jgi:hypothetical protein